MMAIFLLPLIIIIKFINKNDGDDDDTISVA